MIQPILAGFVAAVSGFASSFALVIAGLRAVGASDAQAASGLFVLCLAIAALNILGAVLLRMPIAIAWSTPGAAVLLAAEGHGIRFSDAVGAFLVSAALMVLCGLWPALGRLITRIPKPLASAMFAGVLVPICLAPVEAVAQLPLYAAPVVVVWLVLFRLAPRWAVPAAMAVAIAAILLYAGTGWVGRASTAPELSLVGPTFDPLTIVSIGLPLFIVTMAGQNVPGFTVLTTYGYPIPTRFVFVGQGVTSAAGAFFGGHAVNLGAITAAIMAGPEAHDDPRRRWVATLSNGVFYVPLGLAAGLAAALVAAAPAILITAVAGLAVLGALVTSIVGALEAPEHRIAAVVTFLIVVSGVVVAGIGSPFWGLLVGGVVMAWLGWRRNRATPARVD